jgi:ribosomal-protein-alanine N-acetyltransferase
MSLLERLFGRPKVMIEALGPSHAGKVSMLHATSFSHGWDQPEVARMLSDPSILSDGVFSGTSRLPSGFVMSRLAADEAEILTICIDPDQRGRGLGHLLLERHLANLVRRSVATLFLEVEDSNAPALALYRAFGFNKVGERPGYYPKPDGSRALALILRRDLG